MTRYHRKHNARVPFTAEEETARDNEETAYNNAAPARALAGLRRQRNVFLAQTDFYALSDVTMSEAMTTYRQQLRDLPSGLSTVDHVKNVTWPTKP